MHPVNLALRRPALQSTISHWSTDPSRVVDAAVAVSGDAASPRFFHTAHEYFPWWQVDLGRPCLVDRVEIDNRPDMAERLGAFTLLGSLDGAAWRPLQSVRVEPAARYRLDLAPPALARFLRLRLDGRGHLHFRQFAAFGAPGDDPRQRDEYRALAAAWSVPPGRAGAIAPVGGFDLLIAQDYGREIGAALRVGSYENRERGLVTRLLRPDDRALEVGTAIGLVSMTAAAMIGADRVVTFDANPAMIADAKANFARNGLDIAAYCGALTPRSRFVAGARLAFYVSPQFWASRLVEDGEGTISTPTFCFEEERARANANVLICDIEGGEVDLLMQADLSGLRLVILETHVWAVGEARTDALIRKLTLDGFVVDLDLSGQGVAALRR
ncbi:MAG: FkbM family methyltransferase [Pseudomonadota bacterium]|nr:FkbM family methyltransferase [Pseudomonadota bacterium]